MVPLRISYSRCSDPFYNVEMALIFYVMVISCQGLFGFVNVRNHSASVNVGSSFPSAYTQFAHSQRPVSLHILQFSDYLTSIPVPFPTTFYSPH